MKQKQKQSILIVLLLSAIFLFNSSYATECQYLFAKGESKMYEFSQLPEFIEEEIRTSFNNLDSTFELNVYKGTVEENQKLFTITMSTNYLYIIKINGVDLPDDIVSYNNRLGLDINTEHLYGILEDVNNHDYTEFKSKEAKTYVEIKEKLTQQKILKMLAFVFAESARFESVHNAIEKIIGGQCTISWHDFDFAVHNWKNISVYILEKGIITEKQITGGNYNQLVIPISLENEHSFIEALENGEEWKFSYSAPFFEYDYICCESE